MLTRPLTPEERERIILAITRAKPLEEMSDDELGGYMARCARLRDELEPEPKERRKKKAS